MESRARQPWLHAVSSTSMGCLYLRGDPQGLRRIEDRTLRMSSVTSSPTQRGPQPLRSTGLPHRSQLFLHLRHGGLVAHLTQAPNVFWCIALRTVRGVD